VASLPLRALPADSARVQQLLGGLKEYRLARLGLLDVLGLAVSNRDPLAEFSEHLVWALLGGELASSRIQKGYDLVEPSGVRVQVRYLANPTGSTWVNEHHIRCGTGFDVYALVLYESFIPTCVLVFPGLLTEIGAVLGKKHPAQDAELQLTRANYLKIRDHPDQFRQLGMQVWSPPFTDAS
jgi:hypothetical protein